MLHLSLVTIGACLVGPVNATRYIETLVAFFLALGIGAHALDELQGRPLRTTIPTWQLIGAAVVGLCGAVGLGDLRDVPRELLHGGLHCGGSVLRAQLQPRALRGRFHNPLVLVLSWGAFPILTAYYAQHATVGVAALAAAAFGALVIRYSDALHARARTSSAHRLG